MDDDRARELIAAKRAELQELLGASETAGQEDRENLDDEVTDSVDPSQSQQAEEVDDAIAQSLRDRLAALDRAEERIAAGTYGQSVRSGDPIPDERLEIDPAAELTVQEAAADEA